MLDPRQVAVFGIPCAPTDKKQATAFLIMQRHQVNPADHIHSGHASASYPLHRCHGYASGFRQPHDYP
jgi:hypothetical protein